MNLLQISNRVAGGVKCVVEIPRRSMLKYEYDVSSESLKVSKKFSVTIPYNYGFIPKTVAPDGDCLDVIFWTREYISPLSVVDCSIVGVLECSQEGVRDDKLIVSPFFEKRDGPKIAQIESKDLTDWLEFIKLSNKESFKKFDFHCFKDRENAMMTFKLCNYDEPSKNPFLG